MRAATITVCALFSLALAAGCGSSEKPDGSEKSAWPEFQTEPTPDKDVKPPGWYKPTAEPSPWPLGPQPKYGTAAWRHWCSLRYNSRDIIRPVATPPRIDGKLDDAAWKNARLAVPFVDPTGKPAKPKTVVYLGYDKDKLYIAARLEELYPTRLRANGVQRDAVPGSDDRLKIALAPKWRERAFGTYWWYVNSKGTVSDGVDSNVGWNADLEVAATVEQTFWSIEMALPLKNLGVQSDPWGAIWACRFVRERHAGGRRDVSSWTRLVDVRRGTSNWGHLILRGIKPKPKEPPKPPEPKPPGPPAPKGGTP